MHMLSVLQEAGALFFPVQRKEAKKGWIQESTWQMMALVQAWRKVRFAERAWWNKVLLCILWQGWSSRLVVYMDRDALSSEISGLVALMHRRLAIIERTIDIILTIKTNLSVMIAVKPPMQSWLMLLSGQKGVMIKASMRNSLSFALGKLALFLCSKNGWLLCADAGGDCIQMGRARFL